MFEIGGTDLSLHRDEMKLQHSVVMTLVICVDENTDRDTHSHEICRFWNRKGKVANTRHEPVRYINPSGDEHADFSIVGFSYVFIAIANSFE